MQPLVPFVATPLTLERNEIMTTDNALTPSDFIRTIVAEDVKSNKNNGAVVTRFPPEPNGLLHIGHAKSISLNFGVAAEFGGECHFRFDDTNPTREEDEYVQAIIEDVHWLGFEWGEKEYYASDCFDQLYEWAITLIKTGKAFVCDLSAAEISKNRGRATAQGVESPYRDRSVEENLDLFERMAKGEFEDGSRTLRAKIDMASGNIQMRDPVMYRILSATHHRTGDTWKIYPMYDWAHGQTDSIEGVTHSICTLEFSDHRELYDWYIVALGSFPSRQYEFARLKLNYTVLSKRKLLQLVEEGHVSSWDDPRMPTLCGMRRRGYTPAAIRDFCSRIGVAKADSMIDIALLEHCLREDLNKTATRYMGVLRPLKVVIENYPEGEVEEFEAVNNPEDPGVGTHTVPFSRELYIERDDFMEDPPKKFFRLGPGREVRLRYAYFITCTDVIKDPETGEVIELRCTYDPETRGGNAPDGRKVKSTMHWVSAAQSLAAEVRLYNHFFTKANPNKVQEGAIWTDNLNPDSLEVLSECRVEPSVGSLAPGRLFQFERLGYFCSDSKDSTAKHLVFNRSVTLRDTWSRIQKQQGKK